MKEKDEVWTGRGREMEEERMKKGDVREGWMAG